MPISVDHSRSFLLMIAAIPITYVVSVTVGRVLKRRQQVPLGMAYQLFCVVVAFWLPLFVFSRKVEPLDPHFQAVLKQLDAITVFFGVFFVIALVRRYFWQLWFERRYHGPAPRFLIDIGGLLLFAAGLVYVISLERGEPITGIAVGSTLVAAILGLALQDLLGNIIAGIALEIGRPFRAGDWLVIDGKHLEVMEVNWRSARLRNNDDVYIDIPNKTIAGQAIMNLTHGVRTHALRVQVGFDYSVAPNFVKDRIRSAVTHAAGVLPSPVPKVFLKSFGESAIIYEIKFWIDDESRYNDILDAVHTNVWYEAQRSGMSIPFPTRTVHLERNKSPKETSLESARASLRKQPLFQTLNEQQTEQLLRGARVLVFGRGERVIHQGSQGSSMFIVVKGTADVFVEIDGKETQVGAVQAGEYCGEMSLLTGEPRSATVIARTECEMWEIEKSTMASLLQENRELVQMMSDCLAERRLENEGIIASTSGPKQVAEQKREYTDRFFRRLSSFFEL